MATNFNSLSQYGQPVSSLLQPMQGMAQVPGGGVLQPQYLPQQGGADMFGNMGNAAGAITGANTPGGQGMDWLSMKGMFGGTMEDGTQANGWAGTTLGAAGGLANAWLGMKQYGLAKEQLAENKRQFQMNYDAQKKTTNTRLRDRQRARVASNPGAYQSVGDYMNQNGV